MKTEEGSDYLVDHSIVMYAIFILLLEQGIWSFLLMLCNQET
jgi:hypothetical protein